MSQRKTNRGKIIDFESLLAQGLHEPAVGNMKINGRGDVLGKNGEIVQKAEERARAYYKENPKSSTARSSLKGPVADDSSAVTTKTDDLKTAKAMSTESAKTVKSSPPPQPAIEEPDEFDAPEGLEPIGYKEVELPNGDIEMVPYYKEEDK